MANPFSWIAQSWSRFWSWTRSAFSSNAERDRGSRLAPPWGSLSARQQRYAYWWSFYEATVYDGDINSFAQTNKAQLGLYEDIEPIGNPVAQISEFWHSHLWGGQLDDEAGDGVTNPSALPIKTKNELLRPAIAKLWRDSNWQINKDVCTLQGNVKGDVGIAVVDDTERRKVMLEVIEPDEIIEYSADKYGNCLYYVLERMADDPRWKPTDSEPRQQVRYREVCYRGEGEDVHFQTYLDDDIYPWNGETGEWTEPYGFVPFVLIPNIKLRAKSPFGAPECHAGRHKFHMLDHIASMTSDNVGKLNDPVWLVAGVPNLGEAEIPDGGEPEDDEYYRRRDQDQTIWASDPNAKAQALVANMNLSHINGWYQTLFELVKRDYPELRLDMEFASGDASGRALRVSRQRLERKAITRRATYDDGLVRAQKMAVSIGGMRQYDGYTDFDRGSYEAGELDHTIGPRSLFQVDPEDMLDLEVKEADAADKWGMAGVPVLAYGMNKGWSEKRLAIVKAGQDDAMRRGIAVGRSKQQAQGGAGSAGGSGGGSPNGTQRAIG